MEQQCFVCFLIWYFLNYQAALLFVLFCDDAYHFLSAVPTA